MCFACVCLYYHVFRGVHALFGLVGGLQPCTRGYIVGSWARESGSSDSIQVFDFAAIARNYILFFLSAAVLHGFSVF